MDPPQSPDLFNLNRPSLISIISQGGLSGSPNQMDRNLGGEEEDCKKKKGERSYGWIDWMDGQAGYSVSRAFSQMHGAWSNLINQSINHGLDLYNVGGG
jgi:hypothetical protein